MNKLLAATAAMLALMTFCTAAHAYGAIAVSDEEGETEPGYGLVTGAESQEAAKRKALRVCKEQGNDSCKVVVWFKQCGAYASSSKYYGYGYGASQRTAEKAALESCGRSACKVRISECE